MRCICAYVCVCVYVYMLETRAMSCSLQVYRLTSTAENGNAGHYSIFKLSIVEVEDSSCISFAAFRWLFFVFFFFLKVYNSTRLFVIMFQPSGCCCVTQCTIPPSFNTSRIGILTTRLVEYKS